MPRSQFKTYPAVIVERVQVLYASGLTQDEVAATMGLTQRVVQRIMVNHEIPRRRRIKRDQRGAKNANWKGDHTSYAQCHRRVEDARGKPRKCEHCGTTTAKRFEWASLTKNYADVNDYVRLCTSCHHTMDGHVENFGNEHRFNEAEIARLREESAAGASARSLARKYGAALKTVLNAQPGEAICVMSMSLFSIESRTPRAATSGSRRCNSAAWAEVKLKFYKSPAG